MNSLLAVDLGLKTGLALYEDSGTLVWYRSHNFGTAERLRRGVPGIMESIPDLTDLVVEGGGNLATVWEKEAERGELRCTVLMPGSGDNYFCFLGSNVPDWIQRNTLEKSLEEL